jgi:hypothetical protein
VTSSRVLSPEEQLYLQVLEDLNKPRGFGLEVGLTTRLHQGQIDALSNIYSDGCKLLFQPCGRKFGKTEEAAYMLWNSALKTPYSANYYVAPESSHGRKIIWDTQRLQRFLGEDSVKYIKSIKNQEMMIQFKNGSFIQVVGSENFGAANGLTPHCAVYDEFKRFHHRWHIDFAPNLVVHNAPLLIIGTLPTPGDRNYDQYYEIMEACESTERAQIVRKSTFDNPINNLPNIKEGIEFEINQLRLRGDEDIVQREYYSKIVSGGRRAIFPMLSIERHVKPHDEIIRELDRDLKRMEWYTVADPGSTTCFATLFAAIHPYTKKLYILDELYEKDQQATSTRSMYPKMDKKMMEFYPYSDVSDDWVKTADEAAAWFMVELMDQFGIYFFPTQKHLNKKEHGLSLIKDLLLHDLVVISDRCINLLDEMEKYAKDDKGNIPKKHDHLIDCFRYLLGASNYNMVEVMERVKKESDYERRFFTIKGDMDATSKEKDWTYGICPYENDPFE